MQDLKVALIQTDQFWEDKKANFLHLENAHFSKIKPGECDLILLPEMFNTGFSMNVERLAEEMSGDSIQWLQKWAQKLDCQIGASLIVKDQNYYFNRFVIVSSKGIETHYDKRHLFRMATENEFFEAGKKPVIHQLKGWNIMLQVCYDLRFPVFSRNKTIRQLTDKKSYDLVIYVANWPEKRSHVWNILLQARAIENQAYCIGLNRVGTDGKNISYAGDSALIDPWGNVDFMATKKVEVVKILTLSSAKLTDIATQFPAFRDAD